MGQFFFASLAFISFYSFLPLPKGVIIKDFKVIKALRDSKENHITPITLISPIALIAPPLAVGTKKERGRLTSAPFIRLG